MNWLARFLTSSLGKKLIMSLTGLFLILFLVVHLVGNLQLLYDDQGEAFNQYAYFMTHNPLIKTVSYGLYAFILLHAIQGWVIWRQNRKARGNERYAVNTLRTVKTSGFASKNMGWLGTIIFVFIAIHMYQFWLQMKLGALPMVSYANFHDGLKINNLYAPVAAAYSNIGFVIFYVVSMIVIAIHLWHGFQSSFQTLGLNHRKYTPLIRTVGKAYSVLIPLGFAAIPLYMFLFK